MIRKMVNIRVKLSRVATKKVPALSLVVVALVGMVIGVLAAAITVTQTTYTGEIGTMHNDTGTMAVVDNGLSIVANVPGTTNTSATFLASGTKSVNCSCVAFVVGHWMESISITDNIVTDSGSHTVKVTINSGAGTGGTNLISPVTFTLTGSGLTAGGVITLYIDLNTNSITTPPMTVYVTST